MFVQSSTLQSYGKYLLKEQKSEIPSEYILLYEDYTTLHLLYNLHPRQVPKRRPNHQREYKNALLPPE